MDKKKAINIEVGNNIRKYRESCDMTQEQLAEITGLGVKHISAIERGAVGLSLTSLKSISKALKVPADNILSNDMFEDLDEVKLLCDRISQLSSEEFQLVKDLLNPLLTYFSKNI